MKFAKELEQDLVPEWKAKYLNYKQAKKKLRGVDKAFKSVNSTPKSGIQRIARTVPSPFDTRQGFSFPGAKPPQQDGGNGAATKKRNVAFDTNDGRGGDEGAPGTAESAPINITKTRSGDTTESGMMRYGSIIGSPPRSNISGPDSERGRGPPSLHLPDPALRPTQTNASSGSAPGQALGAVRTGSPDAYHVGQPRTPRFDASPLARRHQSLLNPKRTASTPGTPGQRPAFMRRMMSFGGANTSPVTRSPDIELAAYREFDFRQAEFFDFLDKELDKIDTFYKEKEGEATARMDVLRNQLHMMRDRRLEDLMRSRKSVATTVRPSTTGSGSDEADPLDESKNSDQKPWQKAYAEAKTMLQGRRVGKSTKAMEGLATPSRINIAIDADRDYTRRKSKAEVPYRTAKRRLKIAMQEYYRALELLKSYALLNRTGFRKINKKYDKTVNARPSYKYMNEKVNKAWFVQSDAVDDLIKTVEDLYARYFERGNHKIAATKLRAKVRSAGDYTGSVFRTGLYLAAGLIFGIQGLVYGAQLLFSPDGTIATDTSYLLQIYAGYFMMLMLVIFFCMACRFWSASKINYVFVFEFDTRHHLNWRQIAEIPCFCLFLLGFFLWLNFSRYGSNAMYIYYPVILIGITLILLCFPAPIIYPHTRHWFLYSNFRLVLAGLYPVEFRDFFLGDMYCSETYAMGNIELFFCLYARDWNNPVQCNSSHSRLLGFFSTLPGIWRALQCLRRYADTRNMFPHLANCAKYMCTILYYMTLSLWRVNKTTELRALFICFATINATYCSLWDLVMDWSLLDPYAQHKFLRETLGYKQIWLYYVAMIIDPILRFNWIFYAIYAEDVQHSALLSFFVSFSEVCRRGLWMLFRVENEHCTNVGRFRASRDIPLPYTVNGAETSTSSLRTSPEQASARTSTGENRDSLTPIVSKRSGADLEAGNGTPGTPFHRSAEGSLRRRRTGTGLQGKAATSVTPTLRAVGSMLHMAHSQDYSKKKRPEAEEVVSSDEEDMDGDGEEAERLKKSADLEGATDMREADDLVRGGSGGRTGVIEEGESSGAS